MTLSFDSLVKRFRAHQATIGVVRLGYVGLSLLRTAAARGIRAPRFDIKAAAMRKPTTG
jgi:UDP-N-acetyl-D-mannosaminuronate dehydrogenase